MPNQPTPTTSITPGAAALLAVSVLSGTALTGLVVAQAVMPTLHVYLGSGPLLAAVTTLSGGGFLTHLALSKVMRRMDELDAKVSARQGNALPPSWSPTAPSRPMRQPLYDQNTGRLALADPLAADMAERRTLMEAHLRDQLAAEIESRVDDASVKGFEIGYKARQAEEPGPDDGEGPSKP